MKTASEITVLNAATLQPVRTLTGTYTSIAFDPLADLLYASMNSGNVIRVFNTRTWALVGSFAAGDTVPSSLPYQGDAMIVSDDGRWLFVQTANGIAAKQLVAPAIAPSTAWTWRRSDRRSAARCRTRTTSLTWT